MVESIGDLARFQVETQEGDWIVHIIPEEDGIHSANNNPCILFIRSILTGNTYYYSFSHPDSKSEFEDILFLDILRLSNNRKWAIDKVSFCHMIDAPNVFDANLIGWMTINEIIETSEFDTIAHSMVRRNAFGHDRVNLAIPLLKHKEAFDEMADVIEKLVENANIDNAYINFNDQIIPTLGEVEKNGIYVDRALFQSRFELSSTLEGLTYSKYNIYTSTGRPSNRFGGINYAALNRTDGSRSCFTSRFKDDGRMVVVDYTAFHPRIICKLTNYNLPTNIDIYEYLAKLYFNKKEVDETDIKNAKRLTFKQLYGRVEQKYSHIKYLANLKTFIDEQWEYFKIHGYVETPFFKRKITNQHILDPNPSKVFNYILQAAEGEIAIPRLKLVMQYLQKKKTKAVLYIYDAVLYDFHKDDGMNTLNDIRNIMSCNRTFPMKTYIGSSYHNVLQYFG